MKIAYLGPKGTFTEQAVEELIKKRKISQPQTLAVHSIDDVFDQLRTERADVAVVPLKNTLAGEYLETVQQLKKGDVVRLDSTDLKIALALGIFPQTRPSFIREIRSKDTALREASEYLSKNYAHAKLIEEESTSLAIRQVMARHLLNVAALGSERAMRYYGMKVLEKNVSNNPDNYTTFVFLRRNS